MTSFVMLSLLHMVLKFNTNQYSSKNVTIFLISSSWIFFFFKFINCSKLVFLKSSESTIFPKFSRHSSKFYSNNCFYLNSNIDSTTLKNPLYYSTIKISIICSNKYEFFVYCRLCVKRVINQLEQQNIGYKPIQLKCSDNFGRYIFIRFSKT